jgi:predicted transcriptional regulator
MDIKDKMIELYNQGFSNTQIAKKLDRSPTAVSLMLKRNNIKNDHQRKYTKIEFLSLYEEGLSDSAISRKLNVSSNAISAYRRKLNLPFRYKNDSIIINDQQKYLLVGTLLGDTYMRANKETAFGMFAHSLKQTDYFLYKKNLLKNITGPISFETQIREKVENFSLRTHFKSMRELFPFCNAFYSENGKTLPDKVFIENNFNDFSFAIWYGDDGYRINTRHGKPCGKFLSTNSFSYENQIFLKNLLKNKLNIEVNIMGKKINEYRLYIPAKEIIKVDFILNKYLKGLLDYKI